MSSNTVSEKDLVGCMKWIRELRRWAFLNKVDPWAVRQALLMGLEMDTAAAIQRGITPQALQEFDQLVKQDVEAWIKEH